MQQRETNIQKDTDQDTSPKSMWPQVVHVPQEIVREVVVDCFCKCACKEPEKPDIPTSFWSLDQGKLVRAAGDKEAKRTQEKWREEVEKMMKYWSLDQGLHADVKGRV